MPLVLLAPLLALVAEVLAPVLAVVAGVSFVVGWFVRRIV